MFDFPVCPKCAEADTYQDDQLYVCPHCAHEWPVQADDETGAVHEDTEREVRDSNGNLLVDGDAVILIKDLKLKGSSSSLKKGTKVRSIRIVDGDHEIDAKVDGVGMLLKACFVKKA